MRIRLRQFIALLKANPLFVREWRRVIGRPLVFVVRVAICVAACLVFTMYISPFFDGFKPNPPYTPFQKQMMMLGFAAGFILLDPFNWLVAWLAWRSIDIEHRRGSASALAVSLLSDWDFFWAKTLPTACFSVSSLCVYMLIKNIMIISRQGAYMFDEPYIYIGIYIFMSIVLWPLSYLMNIAMCYFLLIKWPVLRRDGLVMLPTLAVFGICAWIMKFVPGLLVFRNSFTPLIFSAEAWIFILNPLLENFIFIVMTYTLMRFVGPRSRYLFLDESRCAFFKSARARMAARLRRRMRKIRQWHGE